MADSEVLHAESPARVPVLALGGSGHRCLPDRAPRRHSSSGVTGIRRDGHRAADRVRPGHRRRHRRAGRGRPGRGGRDVGLGGPPLRKHPLCRPRSPGRSSGSTAPTPPCSTWSTPGGPDALATGDPGHRRGSARRPSGSARWPTSRRSCPKRGARPDERPRSDRPATARRRRRGPVTTLATPIRLDFEFTPGVAQSTFLRGLEQGKFIGQRCPKCGKVYVPLAGLVPDRRGGHHRGRGALQHRHRDHLLRGQRPLRRPVRSRSPTSARRSSSTGPTSRSWGSSRRSPPTRSAWACGSRRSGSTRPDLGPSLASVKYFRPNGEPDADYETYKEYL